MDIKNPPCRFEHPILLELLEGGGLVAMRWESMHHEQCPKKYHIYRYQRELSMHGMDCWSHEQGR
jgi:hypothetical protein